MSLPSVEVILSWPTPDYDNPETQGPAGHVIVIFLISLAILILAIRLYTRKKITKGFGLDDVLIVIAFVRWSLSYRAKGPRALIVIHL